MTITADVALSAEAKSPPSLSDLVEPPLLQKFQAAISKARRALRSRRGDASERHAQAENYIQEALIIFAEGRRFRQVLEIVFCEELFPLLEDALDMYTPGRKQLPPIDQYFDRAGWSRKAYYIQEVYVVGMHRAGRRDMSHTIRRFARSLFATLKLPADMPDMPARVTRAHRNAQHAGEALRKFVDEREHVTPGRFYTGGVLQVLLEDFTKRVAAFEAELHRAQAAN